MKLHFESGRIGKLAGGGEKKPGGYSGKKKNGTENTRAVKGVLSLKGKKLNGVGQLREPEPANRKSNPVQNEKYSAWFHIGREGKKDDNWGDSWNKSGSTLSDGFADEGRNLQREKIGRK